MVSVVLCKEAANREAEAWLRRSRFSEQSRIRICNTYDIFLCEVHKSNLTWPHLHSDIRVMYVRRCRPSANSVPLCTLPPQVAATPTLLSSNASLVVVDDDARAWRLREEEGQAMDIYQ